MIKVIHYPDTNSVEVTWMREVAPSKFVPEQRIDEVRDEDGNVVTEAQVIPAQTIPAVTEQTRCHSYDDRQMDMLRDDLGAEVSEYEALIAEVLANQKPLPQPTLEEIKEKAHTDIERQRDVALAAGFMHNGHRYYVDQTMIAALNGRLTLWQEGKIANISLPVRRMDNSIVMLDRAEHADLADALRQHGEAIYAASWAAKDAL